MSRRARSREEPLNQGGPREQMETSMNFSPRAEWTSEIYSRVDGGDRKTPNHGVLSCSVMVFSLLIAFAGVGIIILGYLEKAKHLLPLCPNCDDVVLGLYIAGGIVLAIGVLGITAAVARIRCLAIPYTILIVLVGLVFLAGGVVCVLIRTDTGTLDLSTLWTKSVESAPTFICEVEGNLQCSGFSSGCCKTNYTALDPYIPFANLSYCFLTLPNGTFTKVDASYTPVTWPSSDCVMGCSNNNFTNQCDEAIRQEIKDHIIPIAASLLPFGILSVIMGVFSLCMTRKKGAAR
ncbi:tetraspannin-like protein, putative [Bodo saltans]|uniref:Tetraspannin-like protein, putative n=1 Tax=Bodo saltans TaxID=75058 RepID=A0A0S4JPS2_BODSA|nr:tetraspannin-like protein, putative [Bodo saltans]|eukprot:CUG92187.1 tetraspannin-like protein, putative [Bodo saltans]